MATACKLPTAGLDGRALAERRLPFIEDRPHDRRLDARALDHLDHPHRLGRMVEASLHDLVQDALAGVAVAVVAVPPQVGLS